MNEKKKKKKKKKIKNKDISPRRKSGDIGLVLVMLFAFAAIFLILLSVSIYKYISSDLSFSEYIASENKDAVWEFVLFPVFSLSCLTFGILLAKDPYDSDPEYGLWEHRRKPAPKTRNNQELLSDIGVVILTILHGCLFFIIIPVIMFTVKSHVRYLLVALIFILCSAVHYFGYKLNWRFVFCTYQLIHKMKMTPDKVDWNALSKSDYYGFPALYALLGMLLIAVYLL